ncbi:MAG: N-acetylneuraminate synthase family protein [Archangiaceae bacterium]|nr:N-acetylneuraminate synthase family protein [Archangiaceae bacterium]
MKLRIGARDVGEGAGCFVVAEVAQAHDGSLGAAHAYIDAAAKAGADAVKFQTHIAAAESTPGEPFRVKFSRQDASRYEYWKRMEFTEPQWVGLAEHCAREGVEFLSSPFSMQAVELLMRVGVPAWKVGAGEVSNLPMLQRLAASGKPVILSSGMSPWAEVDRAVETVKKNCAVLQCTTSYPCPPEKLGLNVLGELRERYEVPVGLSDHSGTVFAGLAAAALGCDVLEVHIVFSKESFGPDTSSSLTSADLTQLVQGVRFIEKARANPVDKDVAAEGMSDLRRMFGKSLVAARALSAGTKLGESDIALKKPGTGILAARLSEVLGRRLKRGVTADALLAEEDLE